MIISTRENQAVREKALHLGISQISGGSRTSVGGYTEDVRPTDTEQFDVSDQRSLDEVIEWLMELGFLHRSVLPATVPDAQATDLWSCVSPSRFRTAAILMRC